MVTEEHIIDLENHISNLSGEISLLSELTIYAVEQGMKDKATFQKRKEENLTIVARVKREISKLGTTLEKLQNDLQKFRVETTEEDAAYSQGYNTGVNWKHSYRPGGPYQWFFPEKNHYSKEQVENLRKTAELSQHCHKAWFKGFDKGMSDQGRVL